MAEHGRMTCEKCAGTGLSRYAGFCKTCDGIGEVSDLGEIERLRAALLAIATELEVAAKIRHGAFTDPQGGMQTWYATAARVAKIAREALGK